VGPDEEGDGTGGIDIEYGTGAGLPGNGGSPVFREAEEYGDLAEVGGSKVAGGKADNGELVNDRARDGWTCSIELWSCVGV
jgi:hypothetical protein